MNDDYQLSVWKEVLGLCRVTERENIVVLTCETSRRENIEMAMRAAAALGAKVCQIDVPPLAGGSFGQRSNVQVTPLSGHRLVVETLKKSDMVLDLMGVLHSPEQQEILAAQTRMLMVIEPPDVLSRLVPTAEDKLRVKAAEKMLKMSKTMHVTSSAGTDLKMQVGQFPIGPQWGYSDESGHWDHWPSAFVATWPDEGSAEGRVVINAGDMMFPFKSYVQSEIVVEIRGGAIISIEGGFDAKYLRKHLESYKDPAAFGVSHIGWGLHPKASWGALGMRDKVQSHGMDSRSFVGNFLFSTGPNAEAGGSNHSACHVDIP
ncbi:MAG TPA: 2,5-dihydroxypyridine 5,6-dioxygenase, partial [Candidatus Methylacidiphilales bacterium]